MFLSIIMPVRNEGRHIGHTLAQLLRQDYDPAKFEIIVVDGESTDNTCDIVRAIAAVSGESEVRVPSSKPLCTLHFPLCTLRSLATNPGQRTNNQNQPRIAQRTRIRTEEAADGR